MGENFTYYIPNKRFIFERYIWEFTQTHRANSRTEWKTGVWHAAVHEITKSQTQLSDWTTTRQQLNQIIQLKNGQRNWIRFFSKEDIEMADRFKKWCLVSLTTREMQIKKPQWDFTSPLLERLWWKRQEIISAGDDVEKREPLLVVFKATIENTMVGLQKN